MIRSITLTLVLLSLTFYGFGATFLGYYNLATELVIPFLNLNFSYEFPASISSIELNENDPLPYSFIQTITAFMSIMGFYLINLAFVIVIPAWIIMSLYDFVASKKSQLVYKIGEFKYFFKRAINNRRG